MSNEKQVDSSRRGLLAATCVAGGAVGLSTAGVLVSTFQPSERAKAAGAPVEADISTLNPGEMKTVEWRGKPVWILRRTPEMIASLKQTDSKVADPESKRNPAEFTPEYCQNEGRSRKPEFLVAVGICTSSPPVRSLRCRMTGSAASSALATARPSTWLAAYSRTSRRRTTWWCRAICT